MAKITSKIRVKIVSTALTFARWLAPKEFDIAVMKIARPEAVNLIRQEYSRQRLTMCSIPSCPNRFSLKKINNDYFCPVHAGGKEPFVMSNQNGAKTQGES